MLTDNMVLRAIKYLVDEGGVIVAFWLYGIASNKYLVKFYTILLNAHNNKGILNAYGIVSVFCTLCLVQGWVIAAYLGTLYVVNKVPGTLFTEGS